MNCCFPPEDINIIIRDVRERTAQNLERFEELTVLNLDNIEFVRTSDKLATANYTTPFKKTDNHTNVMPESTYR